MAIILDKNFAENTTSDPKAKPKDHYYVKMLSGDEMMACTVSIANYLLTEANNDQFLQEFSNRATTNIGFDLTIFKGLHQASGSSDLLPETHFDLKATGKTPANPGTHGIIYHVYVLSGNVRKKGATVVIQKISYVESGAVHGLTVRGGSLSVAMTK